ncbi:TetR family transcriptional regulator [Pseudoxanthobacter sp. M-2]|uniref:TetR family transcriptional regulator n=1 Tax=Pseudoxanthobacter sp. M-2 TaxID=3078754 RepID=UPI0038FBFB1A
MVRRTKEDAARTRTAILDAAETLFFDQGVGRTSLDEIGARAGVTRGAVYWHFKSKGELIGALFERIRLPQEDMVERAVAERHPDPLSVIEAATRGAIELIGTDPQRRRVFAILFHRCEAVDDIGAALCRQDTAKQRMRCALADGFELAGAAGRLARPWTAPVAARTLNATVTGLISEWLKDPEGHDLVAEATPVLDQLFGAFRGTAGIETDRTAPAVPASVLEFAGA